MDRNKIAYLRAFIKSRLTHAILRTPREGSVPSSWCENQTFFFLFGDLREKYFCTFYLRKKNCKSTEAFLDLTRSLSPSPSAITTANRALGLSVLDATEVVDWLK